MCEALDQRQPLDPVDERDRQTSIGGRFVVVFQSCVGRSASSNPRKGQQTLETLKDRDRNRHLGKQQGEMTGRSTARSTGRSRVEAWSAGEPVFFYGAPDCRRHCGVLRVGEVNCRHCSDIIGRNGAISKVAGWPRFELGGGDAAHRERQRPAGFPRMRSTPEVRAYWRAAQACPEEGGATACALAGDRPPCGSVVLASMVTGARSAAATERPARRGRAQATPSWLGVFTASCCRLTLLTLC